MLVVSAHIHCSVGWIFLRHSSLKLWDGSLFSSIKILNSFSWCFRPYRDFVLSLLPFIICWHTHAVVKLKYPKCSRWMDRWWMDGWMDGHMDGCRDGAFPSQSVVSGYFSCLSTFPSSFNGILLGPVLPQGLHPIFHPHHCKRPFCIPNTYIFYVTIKGCY